MATLNLDHEKVCYLIIKAREFDAKMEAEVPEPGDNPTDDDEREILFDYPDDPTVEEIRGFLATLNEDEVTELLALLWVGAGDYDIEEWEEALADACDDEDNRRPEAFLGMPLLGDFLEEGLAQFGVSCADVEMGRLKLLPARSRQNGNKSCRNGVAALRFPLSAASTPNVSRETFLVCV